MRLDSRLGETGPRGPGQIREARAGLVALRGERPARAVFQQRTNPIRQAPGPSAPEPAQSQALADELGRLERSERETRDRLRQQELERLRERAGCD